MEKGLTKTEIFRLRFKSESYQFNWTRMKWERRFGNLDSYARLMADFPIWHSYVTGHVKPSVIKRELRRFKSLYLV